MEKRYRHIETPSEFGFGFMESVLAMTVVVASENRTAFAHRVKNLLKLAYKVGLKLGVGHGAGKATMYGWEDAGVLGVALELTQLGMPPERAMTLINNNLDKVLVALATACEAFVITPEKYAHRGSKDKPPMQILIWTDPRILTTAMANAETDPDLFEDYLDYGTPDHFMAQLKEMDYAMPRFVVANLTSLISLMSMVSTVKHTSEMAEKMHYAITVVLKERGDTQIRHLPADLVAHGRAEKGNGFDLDEWVKKAILNGTSNSPRLAFKKRTRTKLSDLIDRNRPYFIIPQGDDAQFDLIVRLPDSRKLVVDAKVRYEVGSNASQAVRERVEELEKLPFRQSDETGWILLYLPTDVMTDDAMETDRTLFSWLMERRVIPVSPTRMGAILRKVEAAWSAAVKSELFAAEFKAMVSEHGSHPQT